MLLSKLINVKVIQSASFCLSLFNVLSLITGLRHNTLKLFQFSVSENVQTFKLDLYVSLQSTWSHFELNNHFRAGSVCLTVITLSVSLRSGSMLVLKSFSPTLSGSVPSRPSAAITDSTMTAISKHPSQPWRDKDTCLLWRLVYFLNQCVFFLRDIVSRTFRPSESPDLVLYEAEFDWCG